MLPGWSATAALYLHIALLLLGATRVLSGMMHSVQSTDPPRLMAVAGEKGRVD